MGRPRQDPRVRFSSELDIWELAWVDIITEHKPNVRVRAESHNHAVSRMHKFNGARTFQRAFESQAIHRWDALICRVEGAEVVFMRRPTGFENITVINGDGEVIDPKRIEGLKLRMDNRLREMNPHTATGPAVPTDRSGHAIRTSSDGLPDSSKPLIDVEDIT